MFCGTMATYPAISATRGRLFSINHLGDDIHTIAEIDPGKLPPDHAPGTRGSSSVSVPRKPAWPRPAPPEPKVTAFVDAERQTSEGKNIIIDLMLLYTRTAAKHHIGAPADLPALVIEEANDTFRNSGLGNISLRLVHSQLTEYDEAGWRSFRASLPHGRWR